MRVTRSQTKLGNVPVTANSLPNDEQIGEGSITKNTKTRQDEGERRKSCVSEKKLY